MPQEVFIPSKNKTLTFADDFTEQEIGDYIDANFPRTGEDVAYDLKNRLLDPSWNPSYDDFEKLRSYNKSKDIDTAEVVGSIFDGAVQMGKNLLAAIPATVADPASIPGSLLRGLANNIENYSMLAQGGTNAGTKLFQLMNGDSATAYSTWRESINAARSLHETSNAAIAGLPVNPQQVAAAEIVADPLNLVPMAGVAGKGGAMAAKAVGMAGRGIEETGKAAVRIATYPERLLAGAAEKLAGVPAEAAERTASDLATKAVVLDVATGLAPGATEIAVTKAAGKGVAAAGEAIGAAAAEAAQGGAGMLSSVEKAAMNPNLSTGARAILNVTARLIPRDAALIASDAAKAGLIGAVVGGGLGYLQSTDEEEIGQAIGGGLAAGAMIGGGLKLWDVASGKVAKERVLNDASRNIARAAAAGESEADLGFRADLFSKLGEADRKGNGLGAFLAMEELITQRGGKVKIVDGDVVKGPSGETGWNAYYDPKDKAIYINRSGADATTLPHEAVHSFMTDVLADELTGRLFTKDSTGRLQQTAPDGAIAGLIEGYLKDADNIKHSDGTTEGQRLRQRLDAAFDPATPISEQVSRLRDITHEISARYAEQWVTKQNPRNFLTGAMPTIWSEAVNVARGKLERMFGKETGNPVLDPTLKRIFSPKESGVPEKAGVPLDPRVLTQDYSDKKGKFMSLYKGGDANAKGHWNPVYAQVEPILTQAGASKPISQRFAKNNLSLRGVGDDVIDSLAATNIETPLKSSGPILSAAEAAHTKMAIRAMQSGEMLQGNNYMAFLKDGQAESGVVRDGKPLDKRFAVVDVMWNKDNGVQILAVDIGSALDRLATDVRSKGSASGFDSIAQAHKALNQYLRHVANSEGNFDAAKKGWEIEVDGRPMGKTAHKTLHEALNVTAPKDSTPYRPDINITRGGLDRVNGIEFILPRRITGNLTQTGVMTPISNSGVEAIQRRFQPQRTKVEEMPNGMIAQDADGARIVKTGTSGYRLFDPLGNRIGVFSTLEKAAEAATAQATKDLTTVKEIQYAIQEQRAKEVSVRQRASYREAVRQGDTQGQEAARARFQPQKDEAYLKAVERGDTARAQELADETARAAGYKTVFAFHGTPVKKDINVFDVSGKGKASGAGLFLSSSEDVAKTYAGKSGKVYKVYLKLDAPVEIDAKGGWWGNLSDAVILHEGKDTKLDVKSIFGHVNSYTDAIGRKLDKSGWDSAIIRNVSDVGTKKTQGKSKLKPSDVFIVKDPSQLKSADPITYDNNGNVIPLSKRFDVASQDIRFQPKRRKDKLPKTPFQMGQQIEAGIRAAKQADVAQVGGRIMREGTGTPVEQAVAQEAMAQEAMLFAKPKKVALSEEQITAIRDAGIAETYVKALLNFEDAYTKLTGQEPVGKAYRNEAMKMTPRQRDSILRLALSSDLPQAKLAIEVAREAADPAMRTAIERMFEAQQRTAERPPTQQEVGVENIRRSLQPVLPQEFGVPSMRELQGLRRGVREATEAALRNNRARGEAEAAQIAAEREAKLAQVEQEAAQAATALSKELKQWLKKLEPEIAKAEEVVTAEQEPIRQDRIILKLNGKYRLYGASAGLIGVFRSKEDAIKKAKK